MDKRFETAEWYKLHQMWLENYPNGKRAVLSGAELRYANLHNINLAKADLYRVNLSNADLTWANLTEANLTEANLTEANLTEANLTEANLTKANLTEANLSGASLTEANLSGASLSNANLSSANLNSANLNNANLSGANLSWAILYKANLYRASLSRANLTETDLTRADLVGANLSGAIGLLNPVDWITKNFETDDLGIIVYKRIGNTQYDVPAFWLIEPGSFIEEVCNLLPTNDCGCGVNFATYEWCKDNYTDAELWECRIRWNDLVGVVVPYDTDGKARCGCLELLRIVE